MPVGMHASIATVAGYTGATRTPAGYCQAQRTRFRATPLAITFASNPRTKASNRSTGISCSLSTTNETNRRKIVLGAGLLAAAGLFPSEAFALAGGRFASVVKDAVDANVTASWEQVLQAMLHDAAGGVNGSLRFELDRPENKTLKAVVEQVTAVKKAIDADEMMLAPISWADALVLTGLTKTTAVFKAAMCTRMKEGQCELAYNAYGNKPPNPKLGRVDADAADANGLIPALGSSSSEYRALFERLGFSKTELCLLAPALTGDYDAGIALLREDPELAKVLDGIEKGKKDLTRTSYEVNFFNAFLKLSYKGAKFDRTVKLF